MRILCSYPLMTMIITMKRNTQSFEHKKNAQVRASHVGPVLHFLLWFPTSRGISAAFDPTCRIRGVSS